MKSYRVGAVGYLNAKPLVHGLADAGAPLEVRFDIPSRCATLLRDRDIDIGLIPSIEYLSGPHYSIIPGVAISSDGPVDSVALFSKSSVDRVERIALDVSSRTSVALLKVLCAERFGIAPAFEPAEPDLDSMLRTCDAALLIGDPALFVDADRLGLLKVDLGTEWKAHTGLPFVWAFWAGRTEIIEPALCSTFSRARDAGVAAIDLIAADYAMGNLEIERRAQRYLRQSITFELTPAHELALSRFYASAATLAIVPRTQELRFVGRQPGAVRARAPSVHGLQS